ncbi:DNA-3-methyladenine glycosylase 2 [Deinococcus aquaedulcis]|uniref:DNA-3-methyladenine glycosylase 2 n=1 Tax=Deinococcus aquaedulcis TaxID=2840455 RepID=UPI001C82EB35|nr:Ada metal-binding domain-containing protein [Deinococcus aquaedulcis]
MPALPYSRDFMLERMFAADAAFDGLFYTGVTSTGIFCLPSCRARKPLPAHVAFHATPAQARAAGLRACRRCHPEAFGAGVPPEEAAFWTALSGVPVAEVPGARDLARRLGVGRGALHRLCRDHLQRPPAAWLARERVRLAAGRLLAEPDTSVAGVAFEAGYGSLSAFGAQFRRGMGVSPQAFRQGLAQGGWTLALPGDFRALEVRRDLGRDPRSPTAQVQGQRVTLGWRLPSGARRITLTFSGEEGGTVTVRAEPGGPLSPADALALHDLTWRALGLSAAGAGPLPAPLPTAALAVPPGLRVPLVPDLFDGLVWAVVGQQVTFAHACTLRRRLVERCGAPLGEGLWAPPTPEAVATLPPADLRALGLTGARADLLRRLAGRVARQELNLSALARGPVGAARRTLRAVPGIGPWTAEYVLLRVLGFPDVVPAGDAALAAALQWAHQLPRRPDPPQVQALLAPYAPQRSAAVFSLWHHVHPKGAAHDS